ncbi:MAG TPA: helix-turn-helix transcriptional regulator [Dissulfurispiraceae bacterium]|jgi:transcriptional regulator with XRE-family HTH domain|nr:helix-turn-helix transcriptional regulator [Dissulfurispiraceae bacterium]
MVRLKKFRLAQKLSQKELSSLAGVGQSTIHYIETGQKSPTVKVVVKLAVALGVSIDELLDKPEKEVS